ncbi:MAG: acyltransferase, partial [Ilumatobacteraceae bacterium]
MLRTTTARRTRQASFAHQPALDGVRAVAVSMVLLFHQGWLRGGYVGVSVFFTLSGYLITSLALTEHERTGRLDVGRFYARRLRRLLPASLACLAAVTALAACGLFDSVEHLRRDLYGALAQVYNWVALFSDQTYAELVGGGEQQLSPVAHFWSLAIEEQFYWVWPLVLVVVLRRGRRRRVRIIAAMTAAAAVAAPLIAAVWGPDAAYWATPARLAEILVGALVAAVLHARRRDVVLPSGVAWVGVAGAAVVIWAAITWPSASGPAYEGWLPVFAVASAAVVVGLQVASPLRQVLAIRPLVALGAISYGVYLVHWPVFVVLSAERTGLASVPLFVLRMVVTMPLAVASYRLLEQPIRTGQLRHRPGLPAAAGACAAVALLVAVVPMDATPYWMRTDARSSAGTLAPVDSVGALVVAEPATSAPPTVATPPTAPPTTAEPAPTVAAATTVATTAVPATAVPTTAVPTTVAEVAAAVAGPAVPEVPALASGMSRPVRILVAGDSTAKVTGDGLVA